MSKLGVNFFRSSVRDRRDPATRGSGWSAPALHRGRFVSPYGYSSRRAVWEAGCAQALAAGNALARRTRGALRGHGT
ncbi:hypothetical protein [Streptomyces sp. WAC08241]|uniref:hypothetical protein n=1 Tax=Streptomyces sp. WAC08241 TaxID=2487421 RepID=UPI00269D79BF